jgi:hypothetical protein
MYEQKAGHLSVGTTRSGGKLIDEWSFISPFKDNKAPKLVVQISIDKTKKDSILFCAHADCLGEKIEDTNIEQLRQKVEAALRFQHDMLTGVTWEEWLEVRVCGTMEEKGYWGNQESSLQISCRPMKRGLDPATGEPYTINSNGIAVPFPKPKKAEELDEGETWGKFKGMSQREPRAEYSYLPATPENIAALDELRGRMEALRVRLSAFLRQDVVQLSLADLTSRLPSLPAPL